MSRSYFIYDLLEYDFNKSYLRTGIRACNIKPFRAVPNVRSSFNPRHKHKNERSCFPMAKMERLVLFTGPKHIN